MTFVPFYDIFCYFLAYFHAIKHVIEHDFFEILDFFVFFPRFSSLLNRYTTLGTKNRGK